MQNEIVHFSPRKKGWKREKRKTALVEEVLESVGIGLTVKQLI